MREALFVLIVIVALLALTAIRYRKTIIGMIGLARMLKEAKKSVVEARSFPGENAKNAVLVNCSACGVWVPENRARKVGELFYCSDECTKVSRSAPQ